MAVTVSYKIDAARVEEPITRLQKVMGWVADGELDIDEIASTCAEIDAAVDELAELVGEIRGAIP